MSLSSIADSYIGVDVPVILMKNGFEFEKVKVTNVCKLEDGSFKTIKKITNKCVKYSRKFKTVNEYRNDKNGCYRSGDLHLFAAPTIPTVWCAEFGREDDEYGCIRVIHSSRKRPISYTVQKVKWNIKDGLNKDIRVIDEVLESYAYVIPSCN